MSSGQSRNGGRGGDRRGGFGGGRGGGRGRSRSSSRDRRRNQNSFVPSYENEARANVNGNNRAGQVEKCLLCTQEKPILRFLPCGHSGVCSECSHNWVNCWKSKIEPRDAKVHPDAEQAQTAKRDCVVCTQTIHTWSKCALYPCGHSNVCSLCPQILRGGVPGIFPTGADGKCPICRTSIQRVMKIFE